MPTSAINLIDQTEESTAELERKVSEELLNNQLRKKLGALSLPEYLVANQNAIIAAKQPPITSSTNTGITNVKRPSPITSLQQLPGDCKRCRNCGTPTSPIEESSSNASIKSPNRSLLRKMGKGKGKAFQFDPSKNPVSQLLELQQAMQWAPVIYEHTREG